MKFTRMTHCLQNLDMFGTCQPMKLSIKLATGMNDVLMFEDGFVLQSCNFLTMLLEIYSTSVLVICANTYRFFVVLFNLTLKQIGN